MDRAPCTAGWAGTEALQADETPVSGLRVRRTQAHLGGVRLCTELGEATSDPGVALRASVHLLESRRYRAPGQAPASSLWPSGT